MAGIRIAQPTVVSRATWLAARKQLLAKEKELTRQRDAVNRQRRELPWVRVEKEYVFATPGTRPARCFTPIPVTRAAAIS
jgi:predicted dithiol-disulfide oxidoreductase (DUF899 family)